MERNSAARSRLALRCPVTRALARVELLERFESFAGAVTDDEQSALLVRLDGLSEVNRVEGSGAGDALLRELACRLSALEGVCTTGRYASATFGLIASPPSAWELARSIAHTVDETLEELACARTTFHVGFVRPLRLAAGRPLRAALDDALASARTAGRGAVVEASLATSDLFPPPPARLHSARVLLVEDTVDLRTLRTTGEAEIVSYERTLSGELRRVRTETGGASSETELEVLSAGLAALSRGRAPYVLRTNVSRATLSDRGARDALLDALVSGAAPRERWRFEVDEATALELLEETLHFARALDSSGSSLVVDGFAGERPSRLAGMPLVGLKLDDALFAGLPEDADARDALERAVSAATELRLPLEATRIVHGRAREMLLASGISVGQGPWLRPLRVLG